MFKKIFNSETTRGRANVAKATYASIALMYIYYRIRKSLRKPQESPLQMLNENNANSADSNGNDTSAANAADAMPEKRCTCGDPNPTQQCPMAEDSGSNGSGVGIAPPVVPVPPVKSQSKCKPKKYQSMAQPSIPSIPEAGGTPKVEKQFLPNENFSYSSKDPPVLPPPPSNRTVHIYRPKKCPPKKGGVGSEAEGDLSQHVLAPPASAAATAPTKVAPKSLTEDTEKGISKSQKSCKPRKRVVDDGDATPIAAIVPAEISPLKPRSSPEKAAVPPGTAPTSRQRKCTPRKGGGGDLASTPETQATLPFTEKSFKSEVPPRPPISPNGTERSDAYTPRERKCSTRKRPVSSLDTAMEQPSQILAQPLTESTHPPSPTKQRSCKAQKSAAASKQVQHDIAAVHTPEVREHRPDLFIDPYKSPKKTSVVRNTALKNSNSRPTIVTNEPPVADDVGENGKQVYGRKKRASTTSTGQRRNGNGHNGAHTAPSSTKANGTQSAGGRHTSKRAAATKPETHVTDEGESDDGTMPAPPPVVTNDKSPRKQKNDSARASKTKFEPPFYVKVRPGREQESTKKPLPAKQNTTVIIKNKKLEPEIKPEIPNEVSESNGVEKPEVCNEPKKVEKQQPEVLKHKNRSHTDQRKNNGVTPLSTFARAATEAITDCVIS